MDLPGVLQEFDRLDKSSLQFPDKLVSLLSKEGYKDYIQWLRDEDVSWLVEYLDNVCLRISHHPFPAEPA